MNNLKVNSASFGGIRKITTYVLPDIGRKNLSDISLNIKDGFVKSSNKNKPDSMLMKITQFFKDKDKLVGSHIQYADGSYKGNRVFADGTRISYSATKLSDDLYVAGTSINKPNVVKAHISHDAYLKNGKPNIFTLKDIKTTMATHKNARELTPEEIAKL